MIRRIRTWLLVALGAWQPLHNAHDWNGDEDE